MTDTIAALYVEKDGAYYGLPGVAPWDQERDARLYAGPHPVVAHPPCERWGDMYMGSPLVIARTGVRKKLGDDGGCFAAALNAVRTWGGVLEHPEDSRAWDFFGLNKPPKSGGWAMADWDGLWTCHVEQVAYGHVVRKGTWLLACGVELPSLHWGRDPRKLPSMVQPSKGRIKEGRTPSVNAHGVQDRLRRHTPNEFRDLLISIARSAYNLRASMTESDKTISELKAEKSLGEKLFDAERLVDPGRYKWQSWSEYSPTFQTRYESIALAFVASLSDNVALKAAEAENEALKARLADLQAERDAAREALNWLAARPNFELSHGYDDPEDEGSWRVHRVNGGVNDREWALVATGSTPLYAIQSAMEKADA